MKRSIVALALLAGCAQMGGSGSDDNWTNLVDGGSGMENFDPIGDANWRVEGGALVADRGKGGHLVSKSTYGDFEMRAEFYAETDTNSGIFFRCDNRQKITASTCYEANIWDIRPEPKYGSGALVDVAEVPVPIQNKVGGRWNTMEISARGSQLVVKLNGVQTAAATHDKLKTGPFTLQYGPGVKGAQGGAIKWRKVQIRRV